MEKPWAWLHIKLCPHFLRLRPSFPSPPPQPFSLELLVLLQHLFWLLHQPPSSPLLPVLLHLLSSSVFLIFCISWSTLSALRPLFSQPGDLCHEKIHKSCDKTNLAQITNWVTVKFVCDESSVRRPTSKPYRGLFCVLQLSQMINHHLPRHNKLDGKQYSPNRLHVKVNLSVQGNWPWGHRGYFKFFFCDDMFELCSIYSILSDHFIRHIVQLLINKNSSSADHMAKTQCIQARWRGEDDFLTINASVTMVRKGDCRDFEDGCRCQTAGLGFSTNCWPTGIY